MEQVNILCSQFPDNQNYQAQKASEVMQNGDHEEAIKILEEIQAGEFARDWILENRAGAAMFKATRRREREHKLTETGRHLRKMMKWIDSKEV